MSRILVARCHCGSAVAVRLCGTSMDIAEFQKEYSGYVVEVEAKFALPERCTCAEKFIAYRDEIRKLKAELDAASILADGADKAAVTFHEEAVQLREALKKCRDWFIYVSETKMADFCSTVIVKTRKSVSAYDLAIKFENRGHLMDAYVLALAEIADGRENPVELARFVLRQSASALVEGAKAVKTRTAEG